jgi:hypothetical protein
MAAASPDQNQTGNVHFSAVSNLNVQLRNRRRAYANDVSPFLGCDPRGISVLAEPEPETWGCYRHCGDG